MFFLEKKELLLFSRKFFELIIHRPFRTSGHWFLMDKYTLLPIVGPLPKTARLKAAVSSRKAEACPASTVKWQVRDVYLGFGYLKTWIGDACSGFDVYDLTHPHTSGLHFCKSKI